MPLTTNNLNIQFASPLNHRTSIVKGGWSIGFSSSLFASRWLPMTGIRRSTILVGRDPLYLLVRQPPNHPSVTSSQHSDCIATSAVKAHPPSSYAQTQPLRVQPKTSATAQRTTRSTFNVSGSRVLPLRVLWSHQTNQMNVRSPCVL